VLSQHLWIGLVHAIGYTLYNAAWALASGENVYPILDWNENVTGAIIFAVGVTVAFAVMHMVLWSLTVQVRDRCCCRRCCPCGCCVPSVQDTPKDADHPASPLTAEPAQP